MGIKDALTISLVNVSRNNYSSSSAILDDEIIWKSYNSKGIKKNKSIDND